MKKLFMVVVILMVGVSAAMAQKDIKVIDNFNQLVIGVGLTYKF